MSTSGLFALLFELLGGSPHYMVTGSLSFLPLLQPYREPGQDLDVLIRRDALDARRRAFEDAGRLRVLRLPEVALADASRISRVLVPRTGFLHLETGEGLLDIVLYEEDGASLRLVLGLGIRLSMTGAFRARAAHLRWRTHAYHAAAPEFMFLTKAVGYLSALRHGTAPEYRRTKHYDDLRNMATVADWGFARELRDSLRVGWRRAAFLSRSGPLRFRLHERPVEVLCRPIHGAE